MPVTDVKGRREFVISLAKVAAATGVMTLPIVGFGKTPAIVSQSLTVQQVIDIVLKSIPNAPFKQTVDTIKTGDSSQVVTGIVTAMFATAEVIEKAHKSGANFIIAHEPTFYNHADDTAILENDEVYQFKRDLCKKYNMVIWRCHDYIHAHKPDGVMMGVLQALGWDQYYNAEKPYVVTIPTQSFEKIITLVKNQLQIKHVKVIGDRAAACAKIVIAPGSAGGARQIEAIRKEKPDLFICGELNEWETSEYIRDLRYAGGKTALIVLGHIVSEEPGLQWLAKWLQPQIPGIKTAHIPSTDAFDWA